MYLSSHGSLQPILISRFLLNLRQISTSSSQMVSSTRGGAIVSPTDIIFHVPTVMDSIMGNMGAPLDDSSFPEDDNDDECVGDNTNGSGPGDHASANFVEVQGIVNAVRAVLCFPQLEKAT